MKHQRLVASVIANCSLINIVNFIKRTIILKTNVDMCDRLEIFY